MMLIRRILLMLLTLGLLGGTVLFQQSYVPLEVPARLPATTLAFDGDRAFEHVRYLALQHDNRVVGTPGGAASGEYIAETFRNLGLQVHTQEFREAGLLPSGSKPQAGWYTGRNIIGVSPGTGKGTILFTAHKDAVPHAPQGALDNASGTAVVLELARVLTAEPHRHTYVFAAFDGEEVGMAGARVLTNRRAPYLRDIRLAVNLDMVGFAHAYGLQVSNIDYVTPATLGLLEKAAADHPGTRLQPTPLFDGQIRIGTDGDLFRLRTLPTVDLIDMPGEIKWGYHNARDTVEQISPAVLQDRGRLVEWLVHQGEAAGAFTANPSLLVTSGWAGSRLYLPPWRLTLSGLCLLGALAVPLLGFWLRTRHEGWTTRDQKQSLVVLAGAVLLTGLVVTLGWFWRWTALRWGVWLCLLTPLGPALLIASLRWVPRPNPAVGRLLVALVPPLLFGSAWWLTGRWAWALPAAVPAYLTAVLTTWRPGWFWRSLDLLWPTMLLLPSALLAGMAILSAPTHAFPPLALPVWAMLHALATLVAVWALWAPRLRKAPVPQSDSPAGTSAA